jgi:5-methylcytosine-specific restriction endonuclease McrA
MAIVSEELRVSQCTKCGSIKSFEDDENNRKARNASKRLLYARYREYWACHDARTGPPKKCGRCQIAKSRDGFGLNRSRYDGLNNTCRKCSIAFTYEKYRSDPEFRAAVLSRSSKFYRDNLDRVSKRLARNKKAWLKTDRGRAYSKRQRYLRRSLPATLTAEEWSMILNWQDHRCAKCKVVFGLFCSPHRDHILPASRGGGLVVENVQALCIRCNGGKRDKHEDYRSAAHRHAVEAYGKRPNKT